MDLDMEKKYASKTIREPKKVADFMTFALKDPNKKIHAKNSRNLLILLLNNLIFCSFFMLLNKHASP